MTIAEIDISRHLDSVKHRLESCMISYMSKTETVNALKAENIQPCITEFVWQRLERENREFFRAYYVRMALKEQINRFNELLGKHAEMAFNELLGKHTEMARHHFRAASMPASNGYYATQFQQNGGSHPLYQTLQTHTTLNLPSPTITNGFLPHTPLGQSFNSFTSNEGMNGGTLITESGYPFVSPNLSYANANVVETPALSKDASVAPFSLRKPTSRADIFPVGQRGQNPMPFKFPDFNTFDDLFKSPSSGKDAYNLSNAIDRVDLPGGMGCMAPHLLSNLGSVASIDLFESPSSGEDAFNLSYPIDRVDLPENKRLKTA